MESGECFLELVGAPGGTDTGSLWEGQTVDDAGLTWGPKGKLELLIRLRDHGQLESS